MSAELPLPSDAVAFGRAYAAASPYLNRTAREHINGLCDVIEAMQARDAKRKAIVERLAKLRNGLCNSNSHAEDMAAELADEAHRFIHEMTGVSL